MLWPGAREKLLPGATRLKPVPETTILVTVRVSPPDGVELVTVTVACLLVPTATAPKSRLVVSKTTPAALEAAVVVLLFPPQQRLNRLTRINKNADWESHRFDLILVILFIFQHASEEL